MDNDLISRKEAIERATKEHGFFRGAVTVSDKARRDELLNVMCWLGELPSAQPERIKGHWIESKGQNILLKNLIEKGETWRVCDKCGAGFMIGYKHENDKIYHETFHNFCPKCGAEMEVIT